MKIKIKHLIKMLVLFDSLDDKALLKHTKRSFLIRFDAKQSLMT